MFLSFHIFIRIPSDVKEFCVDTFLPEMRMATAELRPLPDDEHKTFMGNMLGMLIKLAYGGIWEVGYKI